MQGALRPWSADAGLLAASPSVTRRNKLLIGGVAALSASVIAITPVAQNSVALEEVQQHAVALTANATDNPLDVYGELIGDTIYNVNTLINQYAARPFPILGAIVQNQIGYFQRIIDFSAASTAFQNWWENGTRESAPGKTLLSNVQSAPASGNLFSAYENFNRLALFGVQNTVLPWLNGWLFGTATSPSIFTQMAQNVTDAATAFFSTGTLVFGAFQAFYSPISGAAFELSRALGTIGSTLFAGNIVGAITALVNTPGIVLNAFLNGFDYDADGTTNPWAGVLSPKDPACTGRCASGGPLSQLFITIAQKIADAIKNAVAPAAGAAAAVAATSAVSSTDTTAPTIALAVGSQSTNAATASVSSSDGAVSNSTATETGADTSSDDPTDTGTEAESDGATDSSTDASADDATDAAADDTTDADVTDSDEASGSDVIDSDADDSDVDDSSTDPKTDTDKDSDTSSTDSAKDADKSSAGDSDSTSSTGPSGGSSPSDSSSSSNSSSSHS